MLFDEGVRDLGFLHALLVASVAVLGHFTALCWQEGHSCQHNTAVCGTVCKP